MALKFLAASGSVAALGSGAAVFIRNELGEEAVERSTKFYRVAIPAFLEYKFTEFKFEKLPNFVSTVTPERSEELKKQADVEYNRLHEKWAPQMKDVFLDLRGFYLKHGQVMASNIGDLFPKRWRDEMQPLLDAVPPVKFDVIKDVIESDIGSVSELFSHIEETPIGSASIGQVHRAVLHDGRKVIVKVQYPDVEPHFRGDVFAMKRFCELAKPEVLPTFKEIENQFATEFDYRREASNASEVKENLKNSGFANVIVPEVYSDMCSGKVLVMEEIYPAEPLLRVLEKQAQNIAEMRGITLDELLEEEDRKDKQKLLEAAKEGKIAAGNIDLHTTENLERISTYLSARDMITDWAIFAYNWSLGLIPGLTYEKKPSKQAGLVNTARLIDRLLEVHGYEILINRCFNADPHPGNVLLMTDNQRDPKIGLIDYGQVKHIKKETAINLAKAVVLIDTTFQLKQELEMGNEVQGKLDKLKDCLCDLWFTMGFRTKYMNRDGHHAAALVYLGRDDAAYLAPYNFAQWMDYIQDLDPVIEMDDALSEYMMIFRVGLMLRGFGHALHHHRNLSTAWRPYAEQCLKEAGEYESFHKSLESLLT
eukprot:m.341702 g.341702  ORF g.341702 m.341702 type:complete len:594 (-) comp20389_c0_seq1:70-1851(-)